MSIKKVELLSSQEDFMTLKELEQHLFGLYGRRNRIFLSGIEKRISFLSLAVSDLQQIIRKNGYVDTSAISVALARVVARIFCIAENFVGLPLIEKLSAKYPSTHCSYCRILPCVCNENRPRPILAEVSSTQLEWSLMDWCTHLNSLYGLRNRERGVENLLNRLFREVGELLSVSMQVSQGKISLREAESEYALELADTFAWALGIANFYEINLEKALLDRYGEHCSTCTQNPCECAQFDFQLLSV